jgi:uncharacterized protein with HEPN domain
MGRDWPQRVVDIIEAVAKIQRYTAGFDYDGFAANEMVVDAVIRNFAVIGEAARQVPTDVAQAHPEIPWRAMQRMRNILIHRYASIDLTIIWDTLQNDLPVLLAALPATAPPDQPPEPTPD